MSTFAERLEAVTGERGRLCVGIDPHPGLLRDWGLNADPAGLERFAMTCVQAFGDLVGVVKPQSAFFECYGAKGIAVLERVLTELREAGALSILDVKRGDVGSTMDAYARAYLSEDAPLVADAITVSPYLGFGALEPALELARQGGRGVFVLARTSNPEGGALQRARLDSELNEQPSVAQSIVDAAAETNADGSGTVGLVVGATRAHGLSLDRLNGPILAPGFGAQGAGPADLATVFGNARARVLPASAREVLRAGPDVTHLREACRTLESSLSEYN